MSWRRALRRWRRVSFRSCGRRFPATRRAFAVAFARAYLSDSARDPEGLARALQAVVADDLVNDVVPRFGRGAKRAVVGSGRRWRGRRWWMRGTRWSPSPLGDGRSLTVPVARGEGVGLVVYDLPAVAALAALGLVEPVAPDPLSGSGHGEIRDVLTRYFRAFLAGDAIELSHFVGRAGPAP